MRVVLIIALAVSVGLLSACGNTTAPSTTTAAAGASVGSDRYLADAAAAAEAVRVFADALRGVGSPATPARLKAVVAKLDPPLAQAELASQRLTAERLADRRLDEQRARSAQAFIAAVDAMRQVRAAAAAGDATAAKSASTRLAQSVEELSAPVPAG